MGYPTTPERFWAKIKNKGEGCWLWPSLLKSGYGQVSVNNKPVRAHRYAYEISKGSIPKGKMVLHKCDVRACVKPDHLFLGNQQSNMDDMKTKRRQAYGTRQRTAKLTDNVVLEIRKRYKFGERIGVIAKDYSVARCTIGRVCLQKTWTHI